MGLQFSPVGLGGLQKDMNHEPNLEVAHHFCGFYSLKLLLLNTWFLVHLEMVFQSISLGNVGFLVCKKNKFQHFPSPQNQNLATGALNSKSSPELSEADCPGFFFSEKKIGMLSG